MKTRPLGSLAPVRIPGSQSSLLKSGGAAASPTNHAYTTILDPSRRIRTPDRVKRGSSRGARTPPRARHPNSRSSPHKQSPSPKPRSHLRASPLPPRIGVLKAASPVSRYSPSDVSVAMSVSSAESGPAAPAGSLDSADSLLKVTFGTSTDRGARPYQEDRCRVVNLVDWCKPDFKRKWRGPPVLFAGMYDGHGGKGAVTYCHEELHKMVARDSEFPTNIPGALASSLKRLEQHFIATAKGKSPVDVSGVCINVVVIYGRTVTVANIGDCRSVLVARSGAARAISKDHKPDAPVERARVERAGGSVTRRTTSEASCCGVKESPQGPFRVQPGGLAVARSVGDIRCKFPMYGGIPGTVVSTPDVFIETIEEGSWAIVLATDGLWDHVKEDMLYKRAASAINKAEKEDRDVAKYCQKAGKPPPPGLNRAKAAARALVELSIQKCPNRAQLDNITCCVLMFQDGAC